MPWVFKGGDKGAGKGGGYGKGYGKGYGGGGGGGYRGNRGSSQPQALPEGFSVNPTTVFTGTVIAYYKFQGYGFIQPSQSGVIPHEKVFAFWKNISTADRYPSLVKDAEVQFTLAVVEKHGVQTLQAENIAQIGGAPIAAQDEADSKKTYVGGQNLRYTGSLKFFVPKQGYGYLKIDPGFQYDREGVPEEIRVEQAEMNCGGGNPSYMENLQVEFGIWVTTKGAFKGYNVTLPGGLPLPVAEEAEAPPPAAA